MKNKISPFETKTLGGKRTFLRKVQSKLMDKKAISKVSKIVLVGQLIIIIGIFSFAYLFVPYLDYPQNNQMIDENTVEFKFRNANVILIDDNEDFSSPREVNFNEMNINKVWFEPGIYYWKAVGLLESDSREFTINSNLGLELDKENKTLENTGNTVLNISIEDKSGLSGLAILDINVEYGVEVKNETIYRGERYG